MDSIKVSCVSVYDAVLKVLSASPDCDVVVESPVLRSSAAAGPGICLGVVAEVRCLVCVVARAVPASLTLRPFEASSACELGVGNRPITASAQARLAFGIGVVLMSDTEVLVVCVACRTGCGSAGALFHSPRLSSQLFGPDCSCVIAMPDGPDPPSPIVRSCTQDTLSGRHLGSPIASAVQCSGSGHT